jgi:hypothetical protein
MLKSVHSAMKCVKLIFYNKNVIFENKIADCFLNWIENLIKIHAGKQGNVKSVW